MILFFHPRSTRPPNRRFPLSILALAAVVEGREEYAIVDGNLDADPLRGLERHHAERSAELLAVSVMPGPQMAAAIPVCREFRARHPAVPIVWGGYFPSLYPDTALNAPYVDYVVRAQGEDTFVELLGALRGERDLSAIAGLSYKEASGRHVHNPERPMRSPDEFPRLPYHRIEAAQYVLPTYLGSRTAVHQASVGYPFRCRFCGLISVFGSREKMEAPSRTEGVLRHLKDRYGVDSVQFYDNNFSLRGIKAFGNDSARDEKRGASLVWDAVGAFTKEAGRTRIEGGARSPTTEARRDPRGPVGKNGGIRKDRT